MQTRAVGQRCPGAVIAGASPRRSVNGIDAIDAALPQPPRKEDFLIMTMKIFKDSTSYVRDTVVDEIDEVKIYARRNNENKITLNASHHEQMRIEKIAHMLHKRGYAVKRERFLLDAKPHFDVEAVWPGEGEGPYPLPQNK